MTDSLLIIGVYTELEQLEFMVIISMVRFVRKVHVLVQKSRRDLVQTWCSFTCEIIHDQQNSTICWVNYIVTLWFFNIAMGNGPFIDGLPIKHGDFPWLC